MDHICTVTQEHNAIVLPLPPTDLNDQMEMEIYVRFMRHLRYVAISSMEIEILSAMQFTADILDHSDALVAKVLVDLGLRAPRRAFPAAYIDYVERSMRRGEWEAGSASAPVKNLNGHWTRQIRNGEKTLVVSG